MKKGAFFINVTRGGLVDENALADALKTGQMAGPSIGVTAREPLEPDNVLRFSPNHIVPPHMAWYSVQAVSSLKTRCTEEAVRGVRGEKPHCPVNRL